MADLDLLPKPESPSAASDWAIRVSIAVPYFLIGLGRFYSSPDSHRAGGWPTWALCPLARVRLPHG